MGCSINPTSWGDCAGDLLGKAAGGLASAGFDAVVKEFAKGVGDIVKTLATFWTSVPTEKLSTAAGTPVGMLTAMLDWVMLAVGMLSILLVAAHMAITHRGDTLADAGTGIIRFILVTSCQVPALALLAGAGDEFSNWIINTAAGGNFGARVATVFGTALASGPLGTAVVFIGCLLAIVASLAQVIAMVARNGVLIITAAFSPIAAAAAIHKGNEDIWKKLWMWQLAFVLYKPVAATIYAAAFVTIGNGKSATDQLSGLALMIMSVLALPALLRLMMPVSAKMSSGGGGGALAGAAVAASGVGSVMSARRGAGGGSGGGSPSQGPSGASAVNASAAPATLGRRGSRRSWNGQRRSWSGGGGAAAGRTSRDGDRRGGAGRRRGQGHGRIGGSSRKWGEVAMAMVDNRNNGPQPGTADFGNWQKAANIGLFGMNPVVSFAGLILVLGAGGMMMFFGPLAAVIYLVIAALFYVPLAVKIEGKSVFARLVRRGSFRARPAPA